MQHVNNENVRYKVSIEYLVNLLETGEMFAWMQPIMLYKILAFCIYWLLCSLEYARVDRTN